MPDSLVKRSIAVADELGRWLVRDDLVLPIYSIAKPMLAYLINELDIAPHTRVAEWFDHSQLPHPDITVHHLLTHSSGLRDYGHLPAYQQAIRHGPRWQDEDFIRHTLQQPLLFAPGSGFAYANPGYWLLGRIICQHSGLSLQQALQQHVFTPLEMTRSQLVQGQFADDLPHYPASWVWHGLITACASDVVRFLGALPASMHTHQVAVPPPHSPPWRNPHYGYGLMIEPGVMYGHNGAGPGYSAAGFVFNRNGWRGCVLCATSTGEAGTDDAMQQLLSWRENAD